MSIRSRFRRVLGGDSDAADDPEELVFLAYVQMFEAPMIREALAQNGISSRAFDSLSPGTWVQRVNIRVARRDLDAATKVLRALRTRDGSDRG